MRLEDAPQPPAAETLPRGPQGRLDLRRMVCVIVQKRHAPPRSHVLEPAANSAKTGQRTDQVGRRHSEVMAQGDRRQRVEDVVPARHRQRELGKEFAAMESRKANAFAASASAPRRASRNRSRAKTSRHARTFRVRPRRRPHNLRARPEIPPAARAPQTGGRPRTSPRSRGSSRNGPARRRGWPRRSATNRESCGGTRNFRRRTARLSPAHPLLPNSQSSAPMHAEGSRPDLSRIEATMAAVVLLPCVPAMQTPVRDCIKSPSIRL